MTNIDDFREEHLAEKEAVAAQAQAQKDAEDAAQRAEWREKDRLKRIAKHQKEAPVLRRIAEALPTGTTWSVEDDTGRFTISGVDVQSNISFTQELTHQSKRRASPNGRTRITIGPYGNRTSFPQRKDGTHSYGQIAHLLMRIAAVEIAKVSHEQERARNIPAVEDLRKDFGISGYGPLSIHPSSSPELPVNVAITWQGTTTVEKAAAIAQFFKDQGVKL
jgi:hypothetical protein